MNVLKKNKYFLLETFFSVFLEFWEEKHESFGWEFPEGFSKRQSTCTDYLSEKKSFLGNKNNSIVLGLRAKRFRKRGKKFSRGSSKLHAGCPGQVFEVKETFCEKLIYSINTGFWAEYSHSWPNFFEVCQNFNLSVMRNVLRKKNSFWRKKSVFYVSVLRMEKVLFVGDNFQAGLSELHSTAPAKNRRKEFFFGNAIFFSSFRISIKIVQVQI